MEPTAPLASVGTGSGMLAVAACTGDVSGVNICDESDNAASTIDFGSSEATVSEAASVTDSAIVATSALATTTLPIAVACGVFASSASAARAGVRRSSIGTAPLFSMPAEPKAASQATTQPARTAV